MEEEDGYYVKFNGDTVYVKFIVHYFQEKPSYIDMTWLIMYRYKNGEKKALSPKEASEVFFIGRGNHEIRLVSVINTLRFPSPPTLSGKRFFAVPMIKGKLSLYFFSNYNPSLGPANSITHSLIFVNSNMAVIDFNRRKIRKDQSGVFSECPEIIKLIKEKDKSIRTELQIVEKYNSICGED